MTDSHSPVKTHTALTIDPITGIEPAPAVTKVSTASRSADVPIDEEEDYTIKCICGFQDDDGNTVLCEKCITWQHIQCYYFCNGTVPDVSEVEHSCADCDPRSLDAQAASERQSKCRNEHDPRKVKKTTTKSQKRKVKVSESQGASTNGFFHERHDSHDRITIIQRDPLPPAKRPKTSHRSSNSINSPSISLNPGLQSTKFSSSVRNSRGSTELLSHMSPDDYALQPYSAAFLDLYNDDPGDAPMQANLFNDITITRSLSSWSHDVELLREATNGLSPQDVFIRCDQPLASMTLPLLHKVQKEDPTVIIAGRIPQWRLLTIDSLTLKESIVGELKGKIGHMHDYVDDLANRWNYLRHPVPFVFFHPKLPIYIDTRREGSTCRYLRRSCSPNLTMKTILENELEYHFCFVAKHDLEAGTELTIGWVLDEHMRNIFRRSDEIKQEVTADVEEDYVSDWVGKVLADFGGCACDAPNQCTLARYDRRNGRPKSHSSKLLSNGRTAKGRNGYANRPSPPGLGHFTKSGADSEVLKYPDEENDDNRSNSGSLRSKPRSRDMTPARRNPGDSVSAPGVQLSDREKRKIAAFEKNFEQLEQGAQQPTQKKKKRSSGGPSLNAPAVTKHLGISVTSFSQPNTPSLSSRPNQLSSNAGRRRSVSPVASSPQNTGPPNTSSSSSAKQSPSSVTSDVRKIYVDCAVQTDPTELPHWVDLGPPPKRGKNPYISLTRRLFLRCQRDRRRLEAHQCDSENVPTDIFNTDQKRAFYSLGQPSTTCSPILEDEKAISEDDKMNIENTRALLPEHLSFNVPLQKPRPPGPPPSSSDQTVQTAQITLSPPPLPTQETHLRPNSPHLNGISSMDLPIQPSQPPRMLDEPAKRVTGLVPKSIPARPPTVQTTNINHVSLPINTANIANIANVPQPSPVRKKLSVAEYFKLVNTNKSEILPSPDSPAVVSNPLLQSSTPKTTIKSDMQATKVVLNTSGETSSSKREDHDDSPCASKDPKL